MRTSRGTRPATTKRFGFTQPVQNCVCVVLCQSASRIKSPAISRILWGHREASGRVRLVFISRICRMKNLLLALQALALLAPSSQVAFDIYGPMEDAQYWRECESWLAPARSITVTYLGALPPERVPETMASYHALLLPTCGENFGHVIHEAMGSGCIPIISNRTPWRGLDALGVGWDLDLDATAFASAVQRLVDMPHHEFAQWSHRAREFARCSDGNVAAREHAALFHRALAECNDTVKGGQ